MSTFTEWNGPQGSRGPSGSDWRSLIEYYKELKKSLEDDYVRKDGDKVLSTNDFTDTYKGKLDNLPALGAAATRNVAAGLDNTENLVTSNTVKSELDKYVQTEPGKGLSTNDFTNEYQEQLNNLGTAAEKDVADSLDDTGKLVTSDTVKTVLNKYVQTEPGKGLSTNDFTGAYKDKLDNLISESDIGLKFKSITSKVGGAATGKGIFYILGMLKEQDIDSDTKILPGVVFINYTNGKPFNAVLTFTKGSLTVLTDNTEHEDLVFYIVTDTNNDNKTHYYLAIYSKAWVPEYNSFNVALFNELTFNVAGINFILPDASDFKPLNDSANVNVTCTGKNGFNASKASITEKASITDAEINTASITDAEINTASITDAEINTASITDAEIGHAHIVNAEIDSIVIPGLPIGAEIGWEAADSAIPNGWLKCDGSPVPEGSVYDSIRELFPDGLPTTDHMIIKAF